MFDPEMMIAFEDHYGRGSFLRLIWTLIGGGVLVSAVVIALGVNGLLPI
jgi:hypothetical protein